MAKHSVTIPTKPFVEEIPIFVVGGATVSLRQALTIVISACIWFAAFKLASALLSISMLFTMVIFIWIPLVGLFLAFKKKEGRPYEEHLTKRLVYFMSDRHYVLKDPNVSKFGKIEDAEWEDLDEVDVHL